jgi:hypothetical protein
VSKKTQLSNELFKNKNIPPFIRDHNLFKNPVKVQKIFPSIGLPNFCDKVQIEKTLADLTKEHSYVFNVIRAMYDIAANSCEQATTLTDKLQYLEDKATRDANRDRIGKLYEMIAILDEVAKCTDAYDASVLKNTVIMTEEKKCMLRLAKDIQDRNDKTIFKKGDTLFGVFGRLKNDTANLNIPFTNLEQVDAFKIFSKENLPNKEFQIVFSSDGEDGAWDIATMSMRGIKSCQRWDGEYPRCLIGSVLSKFVGIIYLTSGVQADNHPAYTNLGSKMLRRCVIRYAINADEKAPAIIVDKMYPEHDKKVVAMFTAALQKRTKLPVYQAHELGNKLRHFYLPSEKVRDQISDRDWSYQDNPLKSKHDLNIYTLFNNRESIENEINGFVLKLGLFLARKMEDDYLAPTNEANAEVKKTLANLKINTSFSSICTSMSQNIVAAFRAPDVQNFANIKAHYRKYLFEFLMKRKSVFTTVKTQIVHTVQTYASRPVDNDVFISYLSKLTAGFIKTEVASLKN